MAPEIFISYAREDNGPGSKRRGFIGRLQESLIESFQRRSGWKPEIFIDHQMEPGTEWRPELMESLRSAPVFLPVLSASYQASDFCMKEWDAFRQTIQTGEAPSNHPRILPILYEIEFEDLREELKAFQVNHKFVKRMDKRPFEAMIDQLQKDLSTRLKTRLKTTEQVPEGQVRMSVEPINRAKRVFFGNALSKDMVASKQKVASELTQFGFEVVEAEYQTLDTAADFLSKCENAMSTCSASIHFITDYPGPALGEKGAQLSVIELQVAAARKIAAERQSTRKTFIEFCWLGPTLKITQLKDPAYKKLIEQYEYTTGTATELAKEFRVKLQVPPAEPPPPPPARPVVCLIYESGDSDVAAEIKEYFFRTKKWHVKDPIETDQRSVPDVYEKILRTSDYFLFYWGNAAKEWFPNNYDTFVEARSTGTAAVRDPKAAAVYFGSARTDYKERSHWPHLEIRRYDRFDFSALQDFERDVENSFR